MFSEQLVDQLFGQFARITGALAAPSRLKLLDQLCQGEQSVEQLAGATGLSIANTSRHLRVLAQARLVVSRRVPPYVHYRLADEAVCRFWFALRDLATERLAEIEQLLRAVSMGEHALESLDRPTLWALAREGRVTVLDVRPQQEYRAGHVPGAVSIPVGELERRLAELPREQEVVAYCRGPYCVLAVQAMVILRRHGYTARRLQDGFPEWRAEGLPVEVGAQ